jgi:flagellar motor switch/type III secretory pathway protein FliN
MTEKRITAPEAIVDPPSEDPWKRVMALPCRLRVEAPIAAFTVADLLRLGPGSLVRSNQLEGSPAFVKVNGELIGRGNFDVVEDALAIRLTELV